MTREEFIIRCPASVRQILGLDPGPTQTGFCVFDCTLMRPLYSGTRLNADMMSMIRLGEFSDCQAAGVEGIRNYGNMGNDTLDTCEWVGRYRERLEGLMPTTRVYRPDVLLWLCGTARADKSRARQCLIDRLGPVGSKKAPGPLYGVAAHAWSALAVCTYTLAVINGDDKK